MIDISYTITRMKVNCFKMTKTEDSAYFKASMYKSKALHFARILEKEINQLHGVRAIEVCNLCRIVIGTYKTDRGHYGTWVELQKLFEARIAKVSKKGRPKGYRLSAESKAKISRSKTGYKHNKRTKNKISKSVKRYFVENPNNSEALQLWWDKNPKFKKVMSAFMTAYWADRRKII